MQCTNESLWQPSSPGQTAACHCKLDKGNFLLNKHEGKDDVELAQILLKTLKKHYNCLVNPWKLELIKKLEMSGSIVYNAGKKVMTGLP